MCTFTPAVNIGFEETHYYVNEKASQIEVCIMLRSGHLDRPVGLIFSTSNSSAQAPNDYTEVMLETTFEEGRKCIEVAIIDDEFVESDESFLLIVNSTDAAVTVNLPVATVIITDDDQAMIAFQQTQYTASEGIRQLSLAIELTGSLERNATIMVESRDGTAFVHSGDYTAVTETLIFPSGSVSGSALILVIDIGDDRIVEEEEYFIILVTSVDDGILIDETKKNTSIFIEDDDCKMNQLQCNLCFYVVLFCSYQCTTRVSLKLCH